MLYIIRKPARRRTTYQKTRVISVFVFEKFSFKFGKQLLENLWEYSNFVKTGVECSVCPDIPEIFMQIGKQVKEQWPSTSEEVENSEKLSSFLDPDYMTGWHLHNARLRFLESAWKTDHVMWLSSKSETTGRPLSETIANPVIFPITFFQKFFYILHMFRVQRTVHLCLRRR